MPQATPSTISTTPPQSPSATASGNAAALSNSHSTTSPVCHVWRMRSKTGCDLLALSIEGAALTKAVLNSVWTQLSELLPTGEREGYHDDCLPCGLATFIPRSAWEDYWPDKPKNQPPSKAISHVILTELKPDLESRPKSLRLDFRELTGESGADSSVIYRFTPFVKQGNECMLHPKQSGGSCYPGFCPPEFSVLMVPTNGPSEQGESLSNYLSRLTSASDEHNGSVRAAAINKEVIEAFASHFVDHASMATALLGFCPTARPRADGSRNMRAHFTPFPKGFVRQFIMADILNRRSDSVSPSRAQIFEPT